MIKYVKVLRQDDLILKDLFKGNVIVEEKVDGSQFRIHVKDGVVSFGSHRLDYDENRLPDKMFNKGIEEATKLFKDLKGEYMIFAELVTSLKHNTLCYERVPKHYFVIFDMLDVTCNKWLSYREMKQFADLSDLEVVPLIYEGDGKELTTDKFEKIVHDTKSFLGGSIIEGIVIKNYEHTHSVEYMMGMPLMGKYVRAEFKELNQQEWGDKRDVLGKLSSKYGVPARWDKAIMKLTEEGKIKGEMADLKLLVPTIIDDIITEEGESIKKELIDHFMTMIKKGWTRGLPQYYQKKLMDKVISKAQITEVSLTPEGIKPTVVIDKGKEVVFNEQLGV